MKQVWGSITGKIFLYDRRREREEGIDNGDSAEDGKIIVFNNEK